MLYGYTKLIYTVDVLFYFVVHLLYFAFFIYKNSMLLYCTQKIQEKNYSIPYTYSKFDENKQYKHYWFHCKVFFHKPFDIQQIVKFKYKDLKAAARFETTEVFVTYYY